MSDHKVSVVIPRTCWTFYRLPQETDDQVINRFVYSVLSDDNNIRYIMEVIIKDSFVKDGTEEPNAPWVDKHPSLVYNNTVKPLFKKCKMED